MKSMPLSHYIKTYPLKGKKERVLVYSTKTSALVGFDKPLFERVVQGKLSKDEEQKMKKMGLLVPNVSKEKKEVRGWLDMVNRSRDKSNTIVVLNLNCNLCCPYCFEGNLKGVRYMTQKTGDRVVKFLKMSQSANKSFSVQFYGGEPLLSPELLRSMAGRLHRFAKEKGADFFFSLVTNGTLLTRKRVKELLPLGFKSVQVTLDGPRETHNRSRPYKNHRGSSFDRIVKNVKETNDLIEIRIVGNYTQKNYRKFPELLDYLIREGITPDKLKTLQFFPAAKNRGEFALTDFKDGCDSVNEPWLQEASLFLREEVMKRGFPILKIRPSMCMIEFEKDLVINYDGSLYKCPAFIGRKGLEVGDLNNGPKDYGKSHNLGFWKKKECVECAYLPICFGGCRFIKLVRDGHFDDVDCQKEYLDTSLEKMLLQDIRFREKKG